MKGQWHILKTGIRLHGVDDVVDKIWKTCCALHNWLLEIDGFDDCWENGVPSKWEHLLTHARMHNGADVAYFSTLHHGRTCLCGAMFLCE